jgi:hypothetical protein
VRRFQLGGYFGGRQCICKVQLPLRQPPQKPSDATAKISMTDAASNFNRSISEVIRRRQQGVRSAWGRPQLYMYNPQSPKPRQVEGLHEQHIDASPPC